MPRKKVINVDSKDVLSDIQRGDKSCGMVGRRQKAEGRRQKADGRRQTAEGRRQTAEGRRQILHLFHKA
ncbi:hypothetical protein [Fischerella sp. JS2]|uniref:hypothetical protein n=1 Tax=Fischerella sp. JS2 TaxID=2597771 RepID=UPI0028E88B37|nr:hypothetical protein [Fischerella sp. JS2]